MYAMDFTLRDPQTIKFYEDHPWIDFHHVNTMIAQLLHNIYDSDTSKQAINSCGTDELKLGIQSLTNLVQDIGYRVRDHGEILRLASESMSKSKNNYVDEIEKVFQTHGANEHKIITHIREINELFMDKISLHMSSEFPKLSQTMLMHIKQQQQDILRETNTMIHSTIKHINNQDDLRQCIRQNYDNLYMNLTKSFRESRQHEDKLIDVGNDLRSFLEKQKNSTLKGKESEEKLEACLVRGFPYSEIVNQSGKPQSCDYLIKREGKPDILIENKDYANNVPNEELRKFVRDVGYQNKHAILLSQNSGISQKPDYYIEFHGKNILIYLHFVKYDEHKIQSAVQIIDHMSIMLSKHVDDETKTHISMDVMAEINKEYNNFIQNKKALVESLKKSCKDQIKIVEDFQMIRLTELLDSLFVNVDTLTHKCELCGKIMKNHKGLVAHKRSCILKHKNQTTLPSSQATNIVDLNSVSNSASEK